MRARWAGLYSLARAGYGGIVAGIHGTANLEILEFHPHRMAMRPTIPGPSTLVMPYVSLKRKTPHSSPGAGFWILRLFLLSQTHPNPHLRC